ncbi:hypothetical protein [Paraliobacillus sp. PM-2]|uniref:hypothetical protein n=1 Tax=Paraliobacillus sp. PM-2 TaxID=1462524 RepID=UPI000B814CD8|nr:hypothetical protein [Paraliobacillus sp. PM-2]
MMTQPLPDRSIQGEDAIPFVYVTHMDQDSDFFFTHYQDTSFKNRYKEVDYEEELNRMAD